MNAANQTRPLRLLFVANHPTQYSAPLFRRMAPDPRLDIQVAFLSLRGAEASLDPEFGREVKWDVPLLEGYRWMDLGGGRSSDGTRQKSLWRAVRRGGYDAAIIFTGYLRFAFWKTLVAARISGTAVLYGTDAHSLVPRDGRGWKNLVKPRLWRWLYGMADAVIAPSSGGVQLMRTLGVPDDRLFLTPFVVDNDWWAARAAEADRGATRGAWGAPPDAPVVLFCAKLQPWKRPMDLLRAFARAEIAGGWLVFAGDGPLRASLEAEAQRLGVAGRTRFLGFVNQSELPAIYRAADLFVLPSDYEPFGVVVNESILCGCAPAVSDRVGARFDLVRDGQTGWVFPAGDADALAGVLRRALADRGRLEQVARAARQRLQTWSPRENIEGLVAAVHRAAERRRERRESRSA